jgi:coenzyme PQQ synthesis protein D (PqqD)
MAAISLQSSLKVNDEVVFRELDGEAVLLNLASGMYFGLDETGTRMWQLIDQHGELAAVLAALCEEFDAPRDAIERDLLNLALELSEKGLLVPRGRQTV